MPLSFSTGSSATSDERQAATDGSTVARGAVQSFQFGTIDYSKQTVPKWLVIGVIIALILWFWIRKPHRS
jgi:hypothetical protein